MKKKILQAEIQYLPELLGKILLPKPYKHQTAQTFIEMGESSWHCSNCDEVKCKKDSVCEYPSLPIDDWNVAMKYFRETEHPDSLGLSPREIATSEWFTHEAHEEIVGLVALLGPRRLAQAAYARLLNEGTPKDFLVIAAIRKLNSPVYIKND